MAAMKPFRLLYLGHQPASISQVQQQLSMLQLDIALRTVETCSKFLAAIEQFSPHLILADTQSEEFSGYGAFAIVRDRYPGIAVILLGPEINEAERLAWLRQGVMAYLTPEQLPQLSVIVPNLLAEVYASTERQAQERWAKGMEHLVGVIQDLSLARTLEEITKIVRHAARHLTGADGATFVLRDGNQCYYVDEDAIGPLWRGSRFPMSACISGWCMLNRHTVAIEDIYQDDRIPVEAYRPTFVQSLVMVPIRPESPIGAIGNYWAETHVATPEEIRLLEILANTTCVALENVQIYDEIEKRVQDRTAHLEAMNHELEAFAYTLSHDLRSPLSVINVLISLLKMKHATDLGEEGLAYVEQLHGAVNRMDCLIDEILTLHRVAQSPIQPMMIDLSQMAKEILDDLQAMHPTRKVDVAIDPELSVYADPVLLRTMLENLLSNAWKYTSKRSRATIEVGKHANNSRIIYVRDNGVGFDMAKADKLFSPFQRFHAATEFPGTGVGLASVQRIVHKHGGNIWAEAQLNEGSTFYFSLPSPPNSASNPLGVVLSTPSINSASTR